MRRCPGWIAFWLCVAALPCRAQEPAARASTFEAGLYSGGAFSSMGGAGTGGTWSVGGVASWYLKPVFGLRIHYSYLPSGLPVASEDRPLRNHLYDLSLAYRPWAGMDDPLLRSAYLFVGGGGLTSEMGAGERAADPLTVGQASGGLGFSLLAASDLELFGEVAVHGYDPPLRVRKPSIGPIDAPDGSFAASEAKWSVTSRYVVGMKYAVGGSPEPRVLRSAPPAAARSAAGPLSICVMEGSGLASVPADVDPATRDTTVGGEPFWTRYPATAPAYAARARWFSADRVRFDGSAYLKLGPVRVVDARDLVRVGEVRGTRVFREAASSSPRGVIYVPVRPGCQFQAYVGE